MCDLVRLNINSFNFLNSAFLSEIVKSYLGSGTDWFLKSDNKKHRLRVLDVDVFGVHKGFFSHSLRRCYSY